MARMKRFRLIFLALGATSVFFSGYALGRIKTRIFAGDPENSSIEQSDIGIPAKTLEPEVMEFFSGAQNCNVQISEKGFQQSDTPSLVGRGMLLHDAILYSLPEPPDPELPKGNLNDRSRRFDEREGWGGDPLYDLMFDPNADVRWKEKLIDIDGDGEMERALTTHMIMTSGPHLLRIVKDGYVIFEYARANISVEAGEVGGFVLKYLDNWQYLDGAIVRYIVDEDGIIRPLWQQRSCGLEFEDGGL